MQIISFILSLFTFGCTIQAAEADLVIFSYDRPLQLYAFLESVEKYITGIGLMNIVYRSSGPAYDAGYAIVQERFNHATYFKQGASPREDFKPLTLQATFSGSNKYIIFAVDDIVVKDYADLSHCINLLERYHAYGFYLRMGDHLNFCYTVNTPQSLPTFTKLEKDLYMWTFAGAQHDWGYPHTVDMTVFCKKDIEPAFRSLQFSSPNTLEGRWALLAGPIMHLKGLCFKNSKIVNLPLNRVQQDNYNIAMDIEPSFLLEKLLQGYKMDIKPLHQIKNKSAHMNYEPTFVTR